MVQMPSGARFRHPFQQFFTTKFTKDIPPHDPVEIEERWTDVLAMFSKFADMLDETSGRFFLGDQPYVMESSPALFT